MDAVTIKQIKDAITAHNLWRWTFHHCSMCGYPVSYLFNEGPDPVFDGGCDCVRYPSPGRLATWNEVEDLFNRQTSDVRAQMWAEFLSGRMP